MPSWCRRCLPSVQVWDKYGIPGIKKLRGELALGDLDGGFKRLMSLSWGAPDLGFELDYAAAGTTDSVAAAAAQEAEPGGRVSARAKLLCFVSMRDQAHSCRSDSPRSTTHQRRVWLQLQAPLA